MTQRDAELPHLGNRIALRAVLAHTACWAAGRAERSFLRQARLGQLILSPLTGFHESLRWLGFAGGLAVCPEAADLIRTRGDPVG